MMKEKKKSVMTSRDILGGGERREGELCCLFCLFVFQLNTW